MDLKESKRESPFTAIGWGLALQLALPSAVTLVYPALVLRSVGTPAVEIANTLSWTLFALAVPLFCNRFTGSDRLRSASAFAEFRVCILRRRCLRLRRVACP